MPKIGSLISKLQIGERTYKNPEWWSTNHKLKRNVRNAQFIKEHSKLNLQTSYIVTDNKNTPANIFVKECITSLDFSAYKEFAPWSPVFNKLKTIILFKPVEK